MIKRITIITTRKPLQQNLNDELQWLGTSLGLFGSRDRDKSCYRLFLELLKAAKKEQALSSDELANRIGLSRGTVVHHIIKLRQSGILTIEGKKYILRENNLTILIDDLKRDTEKAYTEIQEAAKEIDEMLGL